MSNGTVDFALSGQPDLPALSSPVDPHPRQADLPGLPPLRGGRRRERRRADWRYLEEYARAIARATWTAWPRPRAVARAGAWEAAEASYDEAIEIARRTDHAMLECAVRVNLAELHLSSGDLCAAVAACAQASALAHKQHDLLREAEVLRIGGVIFRRQGEYGEAARDLAESAALAWVADDRLLLADVERETGELHRERGELEEAGAAFALALQLYQRLGARRDQEEMSRSIAEVEA